VCWAITKSLPEKGEGAWAKIIVQFLDDGYLGDSISVPTLAKIAELQLDFRIECFIKAAFRKGSA
jgi:hypothetical protein